MLMASCLLSIQGPAIVNQVVFDQHPDMAVFVFAFRASQYTGTPHSDRRYGSYER